MSKEAFLSPPSPVISTSLMEMESSSKSQSPPLDDIDHPDSSPVGSPELADSHLPQPPSDVHPPLPLSDDLRESIIKQVEYYFSDENLIKDKFLMKYITRNKEGYVPIGVIASFRKVKKLTKEMSTIVSALRESSALIVSSNGKKVKRRNPFPVSEFKDPMTCTVLVENLPQDHSLENLRRVFGEAGNVENIVIRDPHDAKEPKNITTAEKLLIGKLHALVEYDSVEAAEKAVASLNNQQDWRYGLRVKLLKKSGRSEQRRMSKESDGEKSSSVRGFNAGGDEENPGSSEHHQDSHGEEDGDHLPGDKGGEQLQKEKNRKKERNGEHVQKDKNEYKNRHHGHGRRQKHNNSNTHGHGTTSAHVMEPSKPPPGPKMPDGTRGFAMGRGRPLVPNTS